MKIISTINYKGGVGKTTLTANLAGELAARGHRVLMLDVDPQASLTFSFIQPEEWQGKFVSNRTISDFFKGAVAYKEVPLESLIFEPHKANVSPLMKAGGGSLSLVCSDLALLNVDLELAAGLSGGTLDQVHRNYIRIHSLLAEALKVLAAQRRFDYVLIDCPPSFNLITRNAVVASHWLLVPTKPDYLSTLGVQYLSSEFKRLTDRYNKTLNELGEGTPHINPRLLGVLFTMVREYRGAPIFDQAGIMKRVSDFGAPTFDAYLREEASVYTDAAEHGVPVTLRRFGQPRHGESVACLRTITDEFARRVAAA